MSSHERRAAPVDGGAVLTVDMVRCDGHGICAFVDPESVRLDEWGFAAVDATPLSGRRRRSAARAVRACPNRALSLIAVPTAPAGNTVAR